MPQGGQLSLCTTRYITQMMHAYPGLALLCLPAALPTKEELLQEPT